LDEQRDAKTKKPLENHADNVATKKRSLKHVQGLGFRVKNHGDRGQQHLELGHFNEAATKAVWRELEENLLQNGCYVVKFLKKNRGRMLNHDIHMILLTIND
jgi:hypothetical protein